MRENVACIENEEIIIGRFLRLKFVMYELLLWFLVRLVIHIERKLFQVNNKNQFEFRMSEWHKGNEKLMNMTHTKGTVKQHFVGCGPRSNEMFIGHGPYHKDVVV